MDDQKIQKKDGNSSELSKKVQLGSEGAPVFNKNRDLVGVHLAKEAPIVVNSGTILSDMNAKLLSLPPKIQDILQPLIPAQVTYPRPSIPEPTAKESDENFTLNPKQQPEPPKEEEQEHYDIIDLPTTLHPKQPTQSSSSHADPGQVVVAVQNFDDIQAKPIQSFSLFGYAIDLTSHNISILDKSGHMTSRVRDENNFLSGISCLLIPEGLLITGPDPNSSSSAAICTTVEIRDIISMIWDHRYHTSVYFRGAAVIISGLTNAHVERLPSTSSSWERLGLLPELRAYATAIAHGDYIYVLGGIAGPNQDPTTSIFQGDGTTWSRIEMVLLTPLRSAGAFSVRKSLFLFGGYSRGTAANEEVWKLTPATGEMTKVQNFKIEGNLQGMSPAYFSEDVLIPCEGGAVYRFSLDKEKFSQLIDPKVTQPS